MARRRRPVTTLRAWIVSSDERLRVEHRLHDDRVNETWFVFVDGFAVAETTDRWMAEVLLTELRKDGR